ncbi:hypothetical protein [Actinokineospora sp. NBRC 105648]|uniref:hypothetical protein n=1 Tax=Actinokineospora sp. NBRC 105648 TaxID=3032206 RepID=UPI0024A058C8|nr:hypothetical protein [Actinokineospora sp. NBRC 105648]GLZ39150.1 hypothetical protein Acsp05_27740 [Actinokineospora sp. NBRC 105648]
MAGKARSKRTRRSRQRARPGVPVRDPSPTAVAARADPVAPDDPRPPVPLPDPPPSVQVVGRLRLLDWYGTTLGRALRGLNDWLTHEMVHLRVLGVVTWLVLLGGPFLLVLHWGPLNTMWATAGLTGVLGLGEVVRHFAVRSKAPGDRVDRHPDGQRENRAE